MSLDRALEETRRWSYSAGDFAERYDRYRPRPPDALRELLLPLTGRARPALVVDLGCGTGLSTRYWSRDADAVVGVDPNPEMLAVARAATTDENVSYREASAYETGLGDGCADLVTCSQSFHWMEPEPAFSEITRLLRTGGVFAAYEYRSSLTPSPAADAAFRAAHDRKNELARQLDRPHPSWPFDRESFVASGRFTSVAETVLHSVEEVGAERLIGFLLSEGSTATVLASGVTEEQLGIDRLRAVAAAELGDGLSRWWLGYRVVLGSL
jgi:ubiquinone/menaquinone biosynthesis C-methylase UbiE